MALKKHRVNKFGQFKLYGSVFKNAHAFGGSLLKKSHAKSKRPLDTKNSLHVVLKSTKAKGAWSLRNDRNMKPVREIIYRHAKRYGVSVEQYANSFNHLHILVRIKNRFTYAPFIRAVTGEIALMVTRSKKDESFKTETLEKFWDYRPFTRVVVSRVGNFVAKYYVIQNELEALGLIPYQPRLLKPAPSG